MDPLTTPDAYDTAIVSGVQMPGLCIIEGASDPRKWDEKKGHGVSGATIVYTGDGLCKFTLIVRLWNEGHFIDWQEARKVFSSKPLTKNPKALQIYHPYLEELGVSSVQVEEIGQMEQKDAGVWEVAIKMIQYRAPKAASGKPSSSSTSAPGQPKPEDEIDKQIRNLTDQVRKLA